MGRLRKAIAKASEKREEQRKHEESLQQQRSHERELAKLKDQLANEKQKRRLAEDELDEAGKIGELLREMGGEGGRKLRPFKPRTPSGTATAVFAINDIHGEERVDPDTINGLNEYSVEIAERRIENVGRRALGLLDTQRKLSNIRDLVVWLGGDIITGHIHEDLVETSAMSPIEACRWAKNQIVGLFDYWLEHADVKSLTVLTSFGNHGRTTKKPRTATAAKHSYEWWMYWNIADIYEARGDKRVQFKIEKNQHNCMDIQGTRVRFQHGDLMSYFGGVGGISIPVNKAIAGWNKAWLADYDIFGHWHQFIRTGLWTCCNCMIGYNAYAQRIKADYSEPSQTMFTFDRDRRGPVAVEQIFCD